MYVIQIPNYKITTHNHTPLALSLCSSLGQRLSYQLDSLGAGCHPTLIHIFQLALFNYPFGFDLDKNLSVIGCVLTNWQ